jgi:SAM-dependent methyltransferase
MPLVEEMQQYYARRAAEYDASMGYDDPARVAGLGAARDCMARQLAGRRVLEIACGPGFWTQQMAGAAREIVATDFNQSTLDQARQKSFVCPVTLVQADAYSLDGLPADFNAAFAVDWLTHVPRTRMTAFLDGLRAHLVPGANVVFCDQTPIAGSITGVYDPDGNHLQERTLRDGSRFRVIKNFFDDDEYRGVFGAHTQIERFPECRRVVVSYRPALSAW